MRRGVCMSFSIQDQYLNEGGEALGGQSRAQHPDWRLIQILVRRRWVLIGSLVVAIATSMQYNRSVKPMYAATARVRLERESKVPTPMSLLGTQSTTDIASAR